MKTVRVRMVRDVIKCPCTWYVDSHSMCGAESLVYCMDNKHLSLCEKHFSRLGARSQKWYRHL